MLKKITSKIAYKIMLPMIAIAFAAIMFVWHEVPNKTLENAIENVTANAELTVKQFKALRRYYTQNVISKVKSQGAMNVHYDHKSDANTIPLPATMIHDLSDELTNQGLTVKLYSPYPFPNRRQRELDKFGTDAWQALTTDPKAIVTSLNQEETDSPTLRVAISDTMVADACIACHNNHPETPKTGWQIGDVRGVLEVEVPIAKEILAGQSLAVYIATVFAMLMLISAGALWVVYARSVRKPIYQALFATTAISEGKYDNEFNITTQDEAGRLLFGIQSMQASLQEKTDALKTEFERTHRVTSALEVSDTNLMLVDKDKTIIYLNQGLKKLFNRIESIRPDAIKQFDVDDLMGTSANILFQQLDNPAPILNTLVGSYQLVAHFGANILRIVSNPVFDEENQRSGTVIEWVDLTEEYQRQEEEKRQANENARIRQALDNVTSNVLMADTNRDIIYANRALVNKFTEAETDFRKHLPNFNASNLLGSKIDQFFSVSSQLGEIMGSLNQTREVTLNIGDRIMRLTATPVKDDHGELIGSVLEWLDKTAEVAIEEEIASLIVAAGSGDLSQRLELQDKQGFLLAVSEGLNELLEMNSRFVNDLGNIFDYMSKGDLTKNIEFEYAGQLEDIKQNANKTLAKLSDVMMRISVTSGSVMTSANEVAEGSFELSKRTESQASSLEETAASMEQINSIINQSVELTSKANTAVNDAKIKAQSGGAIVKQAVEAMEEILSSSNKINDIIGVIDEIAFQTNLLALNAAVEAARAGEQGRGFAVVASEVRNLSQRSAAAAKEIKDLIRDSVTKVETGANLVNRSGQTLKDIVVAVEVVAGMISSVNNAAKEQALGISQINAAINQMDTITQQNAALVEETSAVSKAMSDHARSMNTMVRFFSTSSHSGQTFETDMLVSDAPVALLRTYRSSPSDANALKPNSGNASSGEPDGTDEWEDF